MNLKIKLELNKELDKQMIFVFAGTKGQRLGGIDFSNGVFVLHKDLSVIEGKNEDEQKKIISEYVDNFYETNAGELNDVILKMNNDWQKDESEFIKQVKSIFKDPEVPEGKYIGYLSIINCNPRFLNNKTFQVYYKHNAGSNYVTAHEVLHFFFYDYASNKHPEIFANLDTNSGIYWDLAELFDVVVMPSPGFISKEYQDNTRPYPAHQKYVEVVKEIWDKNPDIDNWILESYEYLSKENYV
jgi:hypothetical protein